MYINKDVKACLATGLMPFGIDDIIVDDTQEIENDYDMPSSLLISEF